MRKVHIYYYEDCKRIHDDVHVLLQINFNETIKHTTGISQMKDTWAPQEIFSDFLEIVHIFFNAILNKFLRF